MRAPVGSISLRRFALTGAGSPAILSALTSPSIRLIVRVGLLAACALVLPDGAAAQSACEDVLSRGGSVWRLVDDCITDTTLEIPDGVTLDGNTHTITAVDPPGGFFQGAIVVARGRTASIVHTRITADLRSNVCGEGEARLRGIYFDGASGEIGSNTVDAIHRVPSACAEGNAIEVRNRAVEGAVATRVAIRGNYVERYQKSGIVVHGIVDALIQGNFVGSSKSSRLLGPNAVQVGPVAAARVERNQISGAFVGTQVEGGSAILLISSGAGTVVEGNDITADTDVGINVVADEATVANNRVVDTGEDDRFDVGIMNVGVDNAYFNNAVVGFRTRQHGVDTGPSSPRRGQQIEE